MATGEMVANLLGHHGKIGWLIPNRAEGGNNMVLMECMACGKPVLASFNSGHKEVLRRQNAVLIEQHRPLEFRLDGEPNTCKTVACDSCNSCN